MIECRVLGPVELTIDGMTPPAELSWRKNLALLIYLALSPRGSRTRDHLMGLLWSNKPEPAARHSLRESLRVLRRSLGEESLRTEGESVALQDDAVMLDTARLLDYEAAGDLSAAAELVGGEFLEGFGVPDALAFEDWVAAEREVWRGRCVSTLVHHAEGLLEEGAIAPAIDASLRARHLDSRSAIATRVIMKALALSGERAQALQLFRDYSDQMKDLGAAPDREVEALAARIRDQREWQLPQSVLQRTNGAEVKRPPLIGREDVLAPLLDAWRRCSQESTATVCLIDGDPGLGKTRLAEELVTRARLEGAATVTLRAVQADLATPQSGLLALGRGGLLHAAGVPAAPRDALAAFAAADPEWAERFGAPEDVAKPLGVALGDVLRGVAQEQPVLVMVDDAHWLDRESLLAMAATARSCPDSPLLFGFFIAPQHPREELDELRAHVGRDFPGVTLTLRPLDAGSMRHLAEWALPQYGPLEQDRLARRLGADSAGNPLLAVEIAHAVALGLDLGRVSGAWPKPLQTLDQTLPGDLPDAVVAAIRVSFRRLSKNAQKALTVVAVLGDRAPAGQIAAGSGLEGTALTSALDELEWQRWLTGEARGYSFVARIVRDVVARDMVTGGQRERILQAAQRG